MNEARLLHRGEQFMAIIDGVCYVGECSWSWKDGENATAIPSRTYPVVIEAESIQPREGTPLVHLSREDKIGIAKRAALALKKNDGPRSEYLVAWKNDTLQPADTPDGAGDPWRH